MTNGPALDSRSEMVATIGRITGRSRRLPTVGALVERARHRLAGTPDRKVLLVKRLKIFGPIALVLLVAAGYFLFRPTPQPDYRKGNLRKVFSYTLLTDEFNRLPIEKRLELIGQLVQRMKSMSAGDSALMAAFAAGIAGKAREQIEQNASRLAIDLWDKYAQEYARRGPLAEGDRAAYLDATFLEFIHTMEVISGETADTKSDSERLAEVRRQAKRDQENMTSGRFQPPARAMGRFVSIMRDNVGGHATPVQRARGQLLMRDMMRHFRGQDGGG